MTIYDNALKGVPNWGVCCDERQKMGWICIVGLDRGYCAHRARRGSELLITLMGAPRQGWVASCFSVRRRERPCSTCHAARMPLPSSSLEAAIDLARSGRSGGARGRNGR
jgi:hypothetical protein